jgi:23S rRNA (uracil1939-C5)-methyltransferase
VATCDRVRVLAGEPVIREMLLGHTFEIGPNTFFQTNTLGAESLFREALARAAVGPGETVWDLYCGVGALTLPLARAASRVVGVEIVPEAVAAARRNAAHNGVENARFHVGDIRSILNDPSFAAERPDAVVLDPPRDGLHPDATRALLALGPARIVYVSCNPATLARDVAALVAGGYAPGPVRPVDMFPHTAHVECVTALVRR